MTTSDNLLQISQIRFPIISFLIALAGGTLSMWGGSWDVTSHLLRTPETFFTPSHTVLYAGVGVSVISAALSLVLLIKNREPKSYRFGFRLILVGTMMQLIAGPGDFVWHDAFGIDGLLSPTHLLLVLGIVIVLLGPVMGLGRMYLNLEKKPSFLKLVLPISFGVFWFSIMWLVFLFVLPISEGDTHNFNPDPYVGLVLGLTLLPFVFSVLFWTCYKTMGVFGAASAASLSFVMMNVTSNILTSEGLIQYIPWFAAPLICAVASDYLLNSEKVIKKFSTKIAGGLLGSMFFVFCFPMFSMTILDFYVFNDVFSYDVLPTAYDVVYEIWMVSIIPGAVFGMIGMWFASKKLQIS
ncbi:hypothetical protein NsoK4_04635 [Nitrosopumilus sp. K4]|uniref:hypothetical protein n=1 Tax=Nitrosopumilus sp. K4 TaxID=2795383 RepID=UPI001BABCF02|nr:hypothetical protein [Nitrosopumilus sp. K4]QUC65528.1 hypothetical protein NsoK4_04635 [Nitrosopumilus sp. K4]